MSQIAAAHVAAKALYESKGAIIGVSSPLVYEQSHMSQVPPEIAPYIIQKDASRHWLWRWWSSPSLEKPNRLFFIDPGSVDTRMHQEVLRWGNDSLRNRTITKIENGTLRDPKVVARSLARTAISQNLYNPETGLYDNSVQSSIFVHGLSDLAYEFEKQHLNRGLCDSTWFAT